MLKLDQQANTATLVAQYGRNGGFTSDYMGDTQPLPNGNVFVGFGSEPYFSEYSRSGKLLFEGELPGPDLTYRATLEPWVGEPLSPPVWRRAPGGRQNHGVRELERRHRGCVSGGSWLQVRAGRMIAVASAARSGFETAIGVPRSYKSFEVQALDADGRAIGASRLFTLNG